MSGRDHLKEKFAPLLGEIGDLDDSASMQSREDTAARLEKLNYTVPVITPIAKFLRLDKQGLLEEADRIQNMDKIEACAITPDDALKCEDQRIQHITVLLYYYRKLLLLRAGEPEEWDEVDELFVHD